jgi:hypothetical protein
MFTSRPPAMPMSNAAKGKGAAQASTAAAKASDAVGDNDDWRAHDKAAAAHRDAAWQHDDAGNGTKANDHRAQARVHAEKAEAGRRLADMAQQQSRAANDLTIKAEKKGFGDSEDGLYGDPDVKDPRTEKELHADAAQAHDRAAQMHELAGCKVSSNFHKMKAAEHQGKAGGAASSSASS